VNVYLIINSFLFILGTLGMVFDSVTLKLMFQITASINSASVYNFQKVAKILA